MDVTRRLVLAGTVAALGVAATACSGDDDPSGPGSQGSGPRSGTSTPTGMALADGDRVAVVGPDTAAAATAIATALWSRADVVVVVRAPGGQPAPLGPAAEVAKELRVPLLVEGPTLAQTLRTLATRRVFAYPGADGLSFEGIEVEAGKPRGDLDDADVEVPHGPEIGPIHWIGPGTAVPAAAGLMAAVGGTTLSSATDPRGDEAASAALHKDPQVPVVVVSDDARVRELAPARVRTARRAAPLPIAGGGLLPLEGRLFVALYGNPLTKSLGLLGEQGLDASIARAEKFAGEYRTLATDRTVVPAFELIATVAAGQPGRSGAYSNLTPVDVLKPWVEAAKEAGVYCLLDLQSGRSDSLEQAKLYEELLREPHVGLALDPEWRLGPNERPLQRIGHLEIDEINRVGRWLEELVASHDLPAKIFVLHQFQTQMIRDRARLDLTLDHIQWVVHVDGQGGQPQKQSTWKVIREGMPEGVGLGWKNFIDEDSPMLTPAQTWEKVSPSPSLITYQ